MAIFAVISPQDNPALTAAVAASFKERFFAVAPGQFLVSADRTTTTQVNERLGATEGAIGKILVLLVTNYTGWHDRDIWEWLAAQDATPAGDGVNHNHLRTLLMQTDSTHG